MDVPSRSCINEYILNVWNSKRLQCGDWRIYRKLTWHLRSAAFALQLRKLLVMNWACRVQTSCMRCIDVLILTSKSDICFFWSVGDARTQSPPTKNCAPEAPTFGEIAGFNRTKCNARSPPGGTALMITVPSVPGKLIFAASNHIYI